MSRKNDETRIRILKSALGLFETCAGAEVRMSDIAKQAGISRQALYLHFPARSGLLIAAARYVDEIKGIDARLLGSRNAATGIDRLNAFIEEWGNYIPEIYGVGKAFIAMKDSDEAVAAAWDDRMQAVRHGCAAAIKALKTDGMLSADYSVKRATDILWTIVSVGNWEQLTIECGWSQKKYVEAVQRLAARSLLENPIRPSACD